MTTATTQTAVNPAGRFILTESALPVRVFRSGHWAAIDPSLHRNANGTFSPGAVANDVTFSGGGTGPLASLVHDGQPLSVTWPTVLPKPQVVADTATYASVLPGVDLKVTADSQGGFSEVLVVKTAQAAANPALRTLTLTTSTPGQTVSADAQGNLVTRDRHGAPVFFAPAPTMWDSTTATRAAHSADQPAGLNYREADPGARRARIATHLLSGHRIALTPDASLLTGKSTHFPVFIDPNWDTAKNNSPGYFEAQQGCPGSAGSYDNTTYETYGDGVGYNGWYGCTGIEQTYVQFTLPSSVYGTDIPTSTPGGYGATLKLAEEYTASPSDSATVGVYLASSTFGSSADWSNRPGYGSSPLDSKSVGPVTSTSAPTAGFDVTSAVKNARQGATLAFAIRGDENTSDQDYFKRFYVKGTNTVPNLVIQYNAYPKVASAYTSPGTTCNTPTTPPFSKIGNTSITLKAQLSDSDPGQPLTANFTLSHYNGAQISTYTSGGTGGLASWPMSSALPSGDYTWTVQAYDSIDLSKSVTTCHFTVDTSLPPTPIVTSSVFPQSDQTTGPGVTPVVKNPARTSGGTNDFSFDPNGSTDVAKYAYSWGSPPPTVNPPLTLTATGGTGPTLVTLTPPSTGPNVLYVRAINSVGNISADVGNVDVWTDYTTPNVSSDGDFNNDGSPDLIGVGSSSNPGLWLYEGNADGTLAAPMQIGDKGTLGGSGKPSDFNGTLVTHGAFVTNTNGQTPQSLLVRTATGTPMIYQGTGDTGNGSIFSPDATGDNPPLPVSLVAPDGGTGTPTPDWYQNQQLVSVGATQSDYSGAWVYPNDNASTAASPDMWAIQGDALGYYQATSTTAAYHPFTIISPNGWSGKTIISAGVVNGLPALWSADNTTGELDLWTSTSADGSVAAGSPPGPNNPHSVKTVMASTGYATSNYTMLASAGDTGPGGCPQLYGIAASSSEINLIPCASTTALGTTVKDALVKGSSLQALDADSTTSFNGATVLGQVSGDFNGDGKSDIAHLLSYGNGHLALEVIPADSNGDGGFSTPHLVWDGPSAGANTNFVYLSAGDFNHDGKTDLALFYNYTDNNSYHDAIYTLTADPGGSGYFAAPVLVWNSTTFGPNTQMMTAGDFNGDGEADLALFYHYTDYSGNHVAILTLTAHSNRDGGFAGPTTVWSSTSFGPNTKYMAAGDFNGDGKSDIALFYNYTDNNGYHVSLFTLTADANGDGGLGIPANIWNNTDWGPNTKMMAVGDFNGDGKADIALFYNYTDNSSYHVAIFTSSGSSGSTPTDVWSNTNWGPSNEFLVAGDFNGDGKTDLGFYYNYSTAPGAVFTLTADSNGDGGFAAPIRRSTGL
ncbi:FG-GAP-like repeat-containing protein [Streptacidiphilus neutrinimicus]|uniref:FG-GAP-like repeat-containing protein n=1 Tax=Streptacidiphilus neutrinimicus TaxID=105420 RepID=UPI0006934437|nr:FG-GAP-like repeat-containing protein [Streptacidiphilus neutrinimicus]